MQWGPSPALLSYTNSLFPMRLQGIDPQVVPVSVPADGDYVLLAEALPSIVRNLEGRRLILDLSWLLFRRETGSFECADYGGAPVRQREVLRGDYEERMADFADRVRPLLDAGAGGDGADAGNPGNVELIVFQPEANNSCTRKRWLNQAALAVKAHLPGFRVGTGFPLTEAAADWKAQPLPEGKFPNHLDVILTWSYGIYAPLDPDRPENVHRSFYNPADPTDPLTDYGRFLGKLTAAQRVVLVLDSHFFSPLHEVRLGWVPETLAGVAVHWCRFALARPEVEGLVSFRWSNLDVRRPEVFLGAKGLPPAVREEHRALAQVPVTGVCPEE